MSLPQKYKAFVSHGKGKEPTLHELPLQLPGKNQILVKVAFAPINPSDISTSAGLYSVSIDPPYAVGLEGSGTVVAVGEDLKSPFQVGDKVHILGLGTHGQYVLANSDDCRKIKGDLSLEEAASHHVNPVSVVAMGDIVKKGGHKAVIHTAGSSALGRMFVRYFKHKGIPTINIVRKDEYIEELKKEGADYVLNSNDPDFEAKLKEVAHKEKATIAFDAVAGDLATKILENQPENSTLAIYGRLGGFRIDGFNVAQFAFHNKSVIGFWVTSYLKRAKETGDDVRLIDEAHDLLPTVLRSNIQKVFKLDEIKEALEYYGPNSSKGKILIQPN